MSHNIEYRSYNENVDKRKVQAEWDEYVRLEDWQEGSSGLPGNIRWIDHICTDYEDAEEYIEQHDKGWYDQLAVKYRVYPKIEPSKTLVTLKRRRSAEEEKRVAYMKAHSIQSFKADFIGCPNCGSKLKKKFLRSEACPLCGTELRSKTTIDTLARYADNIRDLDKAIKAENRKLNEKAVKKSTVRWLVKIEYHT